MILCAGTLFDVKQHVPLGMAHPYALMISKLSHQWVKPSKGSGYRDEPFRMECTARDFDFLYYFRNLFHFGCIVLFGETF